MSKLKILGYGHYVPETVITNDDFSLIMDTDDEWISSRTGIRERRFVIDENTSDIAFQAAVNAMKDANVSSDDIDLVIVATITPDNFTPSVACMILDKLGIKKAMAFDISAACSGYLYAINTACAILESNNLRKAIVIGAETLSKIVDFNDRSTAILFGDGAGAVVIEAKDNPVTFYANAKTDVENILYANALIGGGLLKNSTFDNYFLHMNGKEVFKFAISVFDDAINYVLEQNNITIDDVDLIIPHQANIRIIQSAAKRKGIDMDKVYINLDKYGNTSAASVAIALSEAHEKQILKKGQKILLVGFGAGLTWSSIYLEV